MIYVLIWKHLIQKFETSFFACVLQNNVNTWCAVVISLWNTVLRNTKKQTNQDWCDFCQKRDAGQIFIQGWTWKFSSTFLILLFSICIIWNHNVPERLASKNKKVLFYIRQLSLRLISSNVITEIFSKPDTFIQKEENYSKWNTSIIHSK